MHDHSKVMPCSRPRAARVVTDQVQHALNGQTTGAQWRYTMTLVTGWCAPQLSRTCHKLSRVECQTLTNFAMGKMALAVESQRVALAILAQDGCLLCVMWIARAVVLRWVLGAGRAGSRS